MISSAGQRSQGRPEGRPLGIHAGCSSKAYQSDRAKAVDPLHTRYALQSASRELLPREKVATCGRKMIPGGTNSVGLMVTTPEEGKSRASFSGLQCCGSSWLCPVCAAKVSERRRVELSGAVTSWHKQSSLHRVLLVTFTLQHNASEPLADVLSGLKLARAAIVSGRWAQQFKAAHGIAGMVRSLEITHGLNGWHPHLHVLYFVEKAVDIIGFERELSASWRNALANHGRYATYSAGVNVKFSDSELSEYIAKHGREPKKWTVSHEVAKAGSKLARSGGRSPWQILYDYVHGESKVQRLRDARLFITYATHFKGERSLTWSRGLRALLALGAELTDEEIAAKPEEGAYLLASLGPLAWARVLASDARADVLLATGKGRSALLDLLDLLDIDPNWYWLA